MKKGQLQLAVIAIASFFIWRSLWDDKPQPLPLTASPLQAVARPLATPSEAMKLYLPAIEVASPIAAVQVVVTPATTATPPAFLARCLDVPQATTELIAQRLTVGKGQYIDAGTTQAVRSGSFAQVYFIAGAMHGPEMGEYGQIGLWAANSLEPEMTFLLSVDPFAKEFSDWIDGSQTDAEFSMYDDGTWEAKDCVKYKQGRYP